MRQRLDIELSPSGIDAAIRWLEDYKTQRLLRAANDLIRVLVENGAEIMRTQITNLGAIDTGELLASVESDAENGRGVVRASALHAVYVEFGTGVVGAASGYPGPTQGTYVDHGWTYFNPNIGENGAFVWTRGMGSRPFAWNTMEELRGQIEGYVKEVFGRD